MRYSTISGRFWGLTTANPLNPLGDCGNFSFGSTGLPTSAQISGTQGTSLVHLITDPHVLQNLSVACNLATNNYFRKYQGSTGSIPRVEPSRQFHL